MTCWDGEGVYYPEPSLLSFGELCLMMGMGCLTEVQVRSKKVYLTPISDPQHSLAAQSVPSSWREACSTSDSACYKGCKNQGWSLGDHSFIK